MFSYICYISYFVIIKCLEWSPLGFYTTCYINGVPLGVVGTMTRGVACGWLGNSLSKLPKYSHLLHDPLNCL